MIIRLTLAALFTIGSSLVVRAAEDQLYLVRDGRPVSTIVTPNDASPWTNQAVEWLNEYVRKASGATLPVVTEDEAPPGTLISIGPTNMAKEAGISAEDLKYDGCKLIAVGNTLYLLGRDSTSQIESQPLTGARGTCRAVLTFLEDFCGIRWFLPGPQGEAVPHSTDISVPKNLRKTFIPAFAYSDGRFPYDYGYLVNGGGTPGAIINNYRKAVLALTGGHSYYHAVPTGEYFTDHPEYFAKIDGKRTGKGNHLCTSNPEVQKLILKWIQQHFDEGYEWVTIGQEDGYQRCECAECEKLDEYRWKPTGQRWEDFQETGLRETPCERLFLTHKWVIDQVAVSHPDKKVMLMCYAPTAWPSKKIDFFGENVICEVMNQSPDYLAAWKGKSAGMACYFYLFTLQCPMGFNVSMTPQEIAAKVRYLNSYGMLGIYHGAETNWGLMGPVFYVFGKMMGDPTLNHEDLVEEYCNGVFGAASGTMQEFFDLIYARLEEVVPLGLEDFNGRNTTLPRDMTTTKMFLSQYPPEFIARLDRLLEQAGQEADSDRARGWVRLSQEHFDFIKLLTGAMESHRAWQASETEANWLELKKRVEAFDAFRTKIITYTSEYTDEWFPGHAYFCQYLTADCERDTKTYFVPWEQRKPGVLERGVKGLAIGFGDSYYYSFVKEPLTLDFERRP